MAVEFGSDGGFKGPITFRGPPQNREFGGYLEDNLPLVIAHQPSAGPYPPDDGRPVMPRYNNRPEQPDYHKRFFLDWRPRNQLIAAAAAGVVLLHIIPSPAQKAAVGFEVSSVNYLIAGKKSQSQKSNSPGEIESGIKFPSASNPDKIVTGVATYTIKKIQQDTKKKTNSIGVEIVVHENKLDKITPDTTEEKANSAWLVEHDELYPAYVAHFNNSGLTTQCNNELDKIAQVAILKAAVLVPESQRANLAESQRQYEIDFVKVKDDPKKFNTIVGLYMGEKLPNQDMPECATTLTGKK